MDDDEDWIVVLSNVVIIVFVVVLYNFCFEFCKSFFVEDMENVVGKLLVSDIEYDMFFSSFVIVWKV